jgi:hypothetical protein
VNATEFNFEFRDPKMLSVVFVTASIKCRKFIVAYIPLIFSLKLPDKCVFFIIIFLMFVIVNTDFRREKCSRGSINEETLNLSRLSLVPTKSSRLKRYLYAPESLITSRHIS